MRSPFSRTSGFTLAELLIALAILGVVATFTIPKVLQSQQDTKYKAIGKEAASMVSGAYDAYKLKQTPTSTTLPKDLFPYMNYVRLDTGNSLTIDDDGYGATYTCSSTSPCAILHNGAIMMGYTHSFGSTNNLAAIQFMVDHDGKATGNQSLTLVLYYNGRIGTWATRALGTSDDRGNLDGNGFPPDPTWFSWN
jgi:prepilin-type N-terminal cleavage/methylation domain-containing protein